MLEIMLSLLIIGRLGKWIIYFSVICKVTHVDDEITR